SETGFEYRFKECFPPGRGRATVMSIRLLKRIVNRDWKCWMYLLCQPMHGPRHTVHEEGFRRFPATVAVGRRYQFLGFGYRQCGKQIREYRSQRAAQPDIEEIGKISITNVVVIWRVS